MLEHVRSKAEVLTDETRQELVGDARSMAAECISSVSQVIRELFTWVLAEYTSIGKEKSSSDTSAYDWEFVSKSVKAIFHELQLVQARG